jgi:hypothetical protein
MHQQQAAAPPFGESHNYTIFGPSTLQSAALNQGSASREIQSVSFASLACTPSKVRSLKCLSTYNHTRAAVPSHHELRGRQSC